MLLLNVCTCIKQLKKWITLFSTSSQLFRDGTESTVSKVKRKFLSNFNQLFSAKIAANMEGAQKWGSHKW